jgi:peptidoglycan-associated lipoprotein
MNRATSLLIGATILVGGCSQCRPGETGGEIPAGEAIAAGGAVDTAADAARADSLARLRAETEEVRRMIEETVQYDFDRAIIRPGPDTEALEQKLGILEANSNLTIQITGHCDERGSNSYNMALGERRARSARKFLTDRGIAEGRLTVRSMGEQQPVDPGHGESAWARNRRSEFTITGGGDELTMP